MPCTGADRATGLWKRTFSIDTHRAGVFHAFGDQDAASAALSEAVAIQNLVDGGAEAVNALMDVDARLDRLLAQVGAIGDVDFLVLFNELDKRHVDRP